MVGAPTRPVVVSRPADNDVLRRTFASLTHPDFRNLWLSMLFMMAGMNMQTVVRGVLTYDLSHSALMVGIVSAGMSPPIFVFALFGGAIADRIDRKRMIQVGQVGMVLNTGVIALLIHMHAIAAWHLLVAAVVQGTLFSFIMPARQSIIPRLVGDKLITNALALNATGMSIMTLAAPGVGGAIYGTLGAGVAYDMIVAFNAIAVIFSTLLPSIIAKGPRKNVLSDMKAAFSYVSRNRTVMALLAIALATTTVSMPARNLLPVYVEELFSMGAGAVGIMLSVSGAGSLVGSLFIAGLQRGSRRGLILLVGAVMSGTSVALLGVAPIFAVGVAIMAMLGLADSGQRALGNSLIMEHTEDDYRGRVSGIWMMNFGLMPLGVLPFAAAASAWGSRIAFGGAGLLLAVFALWFLAMNVRLRRLP